MESSSPEQHADAGQRSARRRLIRGAFAAPAALTLYSGSAQAATSLTCVARRVLNPVNPAISTSDTSDVYLRVQVRAKSTGNGDNAANQSTWVSGADVLLVTSGLPQNSFLGADNWYCLSAGNGSGYTAGLIYTNAEATANNKGGTPVGNNTYIAIRVDSGGRIVGVTDTAQASAVSRSCWTSFRNMG